MATQFVDRKSTFPNRYKIIRADGSSEYVTLERADEPTVPGTPLNAATFNSMQSGFSETGHGHAASDITSGTFSTARIPNISMNKGGTSATSGWEGLKNLLGNGPMILSSNQYGDELPKPGTPGRIFFVKKVVE